MNITRFISWLTLASFVVLAGCTTSKPNSKQLDQLVHRTSALEQQVHNLEVSNAGLQNQLRALQPQPVADAQAKRDKEELQKRTQEFQKQLDGHQQ
jgi:predicted RNase H-like nuclease (RuvC/YqgF family)